MSTDTPSHWSGLDLPSPLFTGSSKLKMGVFHMNCTRGATPTLAEGSIDNLNWPQQARIARLAEDAGLDAIIPIARWRGYGGPSCFNDEQYEPMPWAAAVAAVTERIVVFSTVHVPLMHPVRAAKDVATIDHISDGRFCLNIVAGWNTAEFSMFGVAQREHDERYRVAAEWVELLERLWAEDEEFDFHGEYFHCDRAISLPKPLQRPRPPIMSAGSSPAGRDFAARHADVCFAAAEDVDSLISVARDIKERAAGYGRKVAVWTQVGIVYGATEAEAKRRLEYFVHDRGDWDAATNQMTMLMGGGGQTLDFQQSKPMLEKMITMQGAHLLHGTAEQIVEAMNSLSEGGVDGLATIWMDFERGIAEYRDAIRPVAIEAGLRSA